METITSVKGAITLHLLHTTTSVILFSFLFPAKMIVEKQGGSPRADYGEGLISELSIQMTKDYGKGFDSTNLRKMRQFYMLFPKRVTVCRELSWSHYKLLFCIEDDNNRICLKDAIIVVLIIFI